MRWTNPPSPMSALRTAELREIALALLEIASMSEAGESSDFDGPH